MTLLPRSSAVGREALRFLHSACATRVLGSERQHFHAILARIFVRRLRRSRYSVSMATGIYLLLAAVVYGVLADRLDRSTTREVEKRRRPVALTAVSGELPPTPFEKSLLRDVLRLRNRRVVRAHSLVVSAK